MPQYQTYGTLDSPIVEDGDRGFVGINTWSDSRLLPEGVLRYGENIRIEGGYIVPRKGLRLVQEIFALIGTTLATVTKYTDQDRNDIIFLAAYNSIAIKFRRVLGSSSFSLNDIVRDDNLEVPRVSLTQAYNKMFIHVKNGTSYKLDSTNPFTSQFEAIDHSNQTTSPMNMPYGAEWSLFFRSRLIMPRNETEIVISDILDNNQFDIRSQFTFNKGGTDYVVGAIGWKEDSVLIFMRNSIQQINGVIDLSTSTSEEVTNQYGCVARKTIIQSGNTVTFLSDNGIVRARTTSELKLQEEIIPFSKDIQDQIEARNKSNEENCIAITWNNRLYVGWPGPGATYVTKLAVYNFLLEKWESIDTFNSNTEIVDIFVAERWGKKHLMCSVRNGNIFLMEDREDGNDEYSTGISTGEESIVSRANVRTLDFGASDEKHFSRMAISAESSGIGSSNALPVDLPFDLATNTSADLDVTTNIYDRDKTVTHTTSQRTTNDSFVKKYTISRPGHYVDHDITITGGNIKIKNIQTSASISGSSLTEKN